MAHRTNPFLEIGYSEFEGLTRIPAGIKELGEEHEMNRQRVVASILLDLHLMALSKFIPKNVAIGLVGAVSQNLEGHEGEAAAHCAPRQLLITSRTPQEILAFKIPERALALDFLFAETDILPVNFNICDSRAERYGLNSAFLSGCRQVITAGHFGGQMKTDAISTAVSSALDKYRDEAKAAYRACIMRLKDKLKPAYLFPKERAKWTEQLQITEQYAETLASSCAADLELELPKIQGLIKVYTLDSEPELGA